MGKLMIVLTVIMITVGIVFFVWIFTDVSNKFTGFSDPNSGTASADSDHDGVLDSRDNCIYIENADQIDGDGDTHGDLCDNCPLSANGNQADKDLDGVGDVCDIEK